MERRLKKNGDAFFTLQCADATGTISAVIWDGHEELEQGIVKRDDFALIHGDVGEFNGKAQLTVRRVIPVEEADVDMAAFVAVSPRPRAEMEEELDAWIAQVTQPDCRRLLDRVFGHERLRELYCTAPAAAKIHQAYVHGLLDHTLAVMRLADGIAAAYQPIDRDLLITGALLHDIGKVRELDWRRTITYTTEGRLLGHIPMGASMIDAMIDEMKRRDGFDDHYHQHILHLILSHHGKQEWGSPVTPKTREAFVLHYADHTEAYMASFVNEVREAGEKGEPWTGYSRMFESYLYTGADRQATASPGAAPEPLFNTEGKRGPMDDTGVAR